MKTATRMVAAVAALGLMAPIPAALAKSPRAKIVKGTCSAGTLAKLKAKPDNGKLEVEFEIDQNRNGVQWNWGLSRGGKTIRSGAATTHAPSGSFSIERRISNLAGPDTISMRATRAGETCTATITI